MADVTLQSETLSDLAAKTLRVGCVSFLNAIPLIDGIDGLHDVSVNYDVPSALLSQLEQGNVDVALCPVIDFQRSEVPLEVIPAGGIGCNGPTLTVRIYSRVPIASATSIAADTDSHTSVVLMRVLLKELFDIEPAIVPFDANTDPSQSNDAQVDTQTMLLIGDKVVTRAPSDEAYPHQLDLGEAWHDLTGLPFVFAVWMVRQDGTLGKLPQLLDDARKRNVERIDELVERHAASHDWPQDIAKKYLGHWLRYEIGDAQLEAMELFYSKAHAHGFLPALRPLQVRPIR